MLSHEWSELEVLCERISDLRQRYNAAMNTKNVGLIDGLRTDLRLAVRMREQLVQHISARLGSAAAGDAGSGSGRGEGPAGKDETAFGGEGYAAARADATDLSRSR